MQQLEKILKWFFSILKFEPEHVEQITKVLSAEIMYDTLKEIVPEERFDNYQEALRSGDQRQVNEFNKNLSTKAFSKALTSNTYKRINKFLIDVSNKLDDSAVEEFTNLVQNAIKLPESALIN